MSSGPYYYVLQLRPSVIDLLCFLACYLSYSERITTEPFGTGIGWAIIVTFSAGHISRSNNKLLNQLTYAFSESSEVVPIREGSRYSLILSRAFITVGTVSFVI